MGRDDGLDSYPLSKSSPPRLALVFYLLTIVATESHYIPDRTMAIRSVCQ